MSDIMVSAIRAVQEAAKAHNGTILLGLASRQVVRGHFKEFIGPVARWTGVTVTRPGPRSSDDPIETHVRLDRVEYVTFDV